MNRYNRAVRLFYNLTLLLTVALLHSCGDVIGTTALPPLTGDLPVTHDADNSSAEIATFGAGCFWCVEAVFEQIDGITDVRSGYMGGETEKPTYDQICTGTTGHAEVVQVTFDSDQLTYEQLLEWFWRLHDPTTLNQQGNDVGTQYRSAIFCHSKEQQQFALTSKESAQASGTYARPIVTEITEAGTFWEAEDYHQDFYRANGGHPYCQMIIAPKLGKMGLEP